MEFCPSRNALAVCGEVMVLQWTVVDRKGAMRVLLDQTPLTLKRMPSLSEKSLPQKGSWDKLDLGGASLRRTCIDPWPSLFGVVCCCGSCCHIIDLKF